MSIKLCVDDLDKHPIAREGFRYLQGSGLIFPGSAIEGKHVEKALERKYAPGCWKFLGSFLLLKSKIESEGFFVTQSNIDPPGFRILHTEEMADFCQKKLMKNLASNYKLSYIMAASDVSSLDERAKKKHKHVQSQAAQTAMIQQKLLLENTYF